MGIIIRVMLFAALFFIIITWLKNLLGGRRANPQTQKHSVNRRVQKPKQEMASCKKCGLFIPEEDAIIGRHGSYCSLAHKMQDEGQD